MPCGRGRKEVAEIDKGGGETHGAAARNRAPWCSAQLLVYYVPVLLRVTGSSFRSFYEGVWVFLLFRGKGHVGDPLPANNGGAKKKKKRQTQTKKKAAAVSVVTRPAHYADSFCLLACSPSEIQDTLPPRRGPHHSQSAWAWCAALGGRLSAEEWLLVIRRVSPHAVQYASYSTGTQTGFEVFRGTFSGYQNKATRKTSVEKEIYRVSQLNPKRSIFFYYQLFFRFFFLFFKLVRQRDFHETDRQSGRKRSSVCERPSFRLH